MYWRMLGVDASFSHARMIEVLIQDLEGRMKLVDNVHACSEYVFITDKLTKRGMLPHHFSVRPIIIFQTLACIGMIAAAALDSVYNLPTAYITIMYPLLLLFVFAGIN